MEVPPPERRCAARPDEVFAAARRVVELLGYVPLAIDAEGRTLSFSVGGSTSFGDDPVTVVVTPDGLGSRVIVSGTDRGSAVRTAFVPRGQLAWNGRGPVSSRFLDGLARDLLTPGAGVRYSDARIRGGGLSPDGCVSTRPRRLTQVWSQDGRYAFQ